MRGLWQKTAAAQMVLLVAANAAFADCTMYDEQIRQVESEIARLEAVFTGPNIGLYPDVGNDEEQLARSEMVRLGCNRTSRRNDPECVAVYDRIKKAVAFRKAVIEGKRWQAQPRREELWQHLRMLKAERQSCRAVKRNARRPSRHTPPQPVDDVMAAQVIGTFIGIGVGAAAARSARPPAMAPARPQYGPRVPIRCHPGPNGRMHCGGN